jgi:hypothetical protein
MTERVPLETLVRYHGSIGYAHGDYRVSGYCDPHQRYDLTDSHIEEHWPDGVAYELWPDGMERKFGLRDNALLYVRRSSFTILEG